MHAVVFDMWTTSMERFEASTNSIISDEVGSEYFDAVFCLVGRWLEEE